MSSTKLSVNVNRVALLRNSRDVGIPDVAALARTALEAGAAGITVHPRPDERHVRPRDVDDLAALVADFRGREYNIEGNPFLGEFMNHCRRVRPTQATFVPDAPDQRTSDHGYTLDDATIARLRPMVEELRGRGVRVSLFMDPDPAMVERVPLTGADRVELYTEGYARGFVEGGAALERAWECFRAAAAHAQRLGLGVNAGHDLNLHNLPRFVTIAGILEVSIGHALVADALTMGMSGAVRAYLDALG